MCGIARGISDVLCGSDRVEIVVASIEQTVRCA